VELLLGGERKRGGSDSRYCSHENDWLFDSLLLLVSLLNKKQNQNSKLELGIKLGLMLI
jgi:hypothetical protein